MKQQESQQLEVRRDDAFQSQLPRNVRVLGWSSLLNDVASEAVYPLLPQFILSLGGDRTLIGLTEGLADSVSSLLKIWCGRWSDRVQRRMPFVVAGYTIAGLSRPLLAAVTLAWQVTAIRILDRLGKGLRTAPRDAMISESTDKRFHGRAFGYHRAMDHLGAAIGPLLAALFLWFLPTGLRWLMVLAIIPGLLVLALQYWGLQETESSNRDRPTGRLQVPTGRFRWFLLALLVFTFANSSDAFLLVRATEAGMALYMLPILWSAFHVLKSIGNRWCGSLADRYSPRMLIVAGWIIYAIAYAAFGWASQTWHIWLLFAVYAGFYAITEPAEKKLVASFSKEGEAGSAFGWFHSVLGIANLPSGLAFGWIYQEYGARIAFGLGAVLAIVASIIMVKVTERVSPSSLPG